jgi:hypothetical protein
MGIATGRKERIGKLDLEFRMSYLYMSLHWAEPPGFHGLHRRGRVFQYKVVSWDRPAG